ncbi:hypothetical protein AYI95_10635 [Shewanella xiamenensis]|nr:hypothetical protein AYI95_10635 [Shewanella xiamenensis]
MISALALNLKKVVPIRSFYKHQFLLRFIISIVLANARNIDFIAFQTSFESKSWGFTPHPTKKDCSSYPPWILQDAPNGVESPLGI